MSDTAEHIAELLRNGRKLQAIKVLRERTGISLKQAKEEIDRLSGELSAPPTAAPQQTTTPGALPSDVQALLAEGKKIEAIKVLREQTGVGLKEAKQRVDAAGGVNRQSKLMLAILLILLGLGLFFALAVSMLA